jgi:hypothetical protein
VRSVGPLALVGLCLWPHITLAQSRSDLARIDADLARVVDLKIDDIKRRSTIGDRVSEATSRLTAAQAEWRTWREVECAAEAAIAVLISARTLEDLTLRCMYFMAERRIEDIGKYQWSGFDSQR